MATIIIGAGIIGAATAFYLTELDGIDPSTIHVIESSPELAASASGYAGGFLAKDWFSPASESLGALSYDLHAELATRYDGAKTWGYSRTTSYSLTSSTTSERGEDWLLNGSRVSVSKEKKVIVEERSDDEPAWLIRAQGDGLEVIDPRRLTLFLLETVSKRGVTLHQPYTAKKINLSTAGVPVSLEISQSRATGDDDTTTTIPCTHIILTAGAWTPLVFQTLFPNERQHIPITTLAGHSLLLRTSKWSDSTDVINEPTIKTAGKGCHAIFSSKYSQGIGEWSPEIFSRMGGEIYIAGLNDVNLPLPRLATDRVIEPKKLAVVLEAAKRLIGVEEGNELEVLRQGLCFRPVTDRGTPIIDEVRKGVIVAAGHGPWGISLSLGTGKVVAEMLLGRKLSADISGLKL